MKDGSGKNTEEASIHRCVPYFLSVAILHIHMVPNQTKY